jgi:hypothetical protein
MFCSKRTRFYCNVFLVFGFWLPKLLSSFVMSACFVPKSYHLGYMSSYPLPSGLSNIFSKVSCQDVCMPNRCSFFCLLGLCSCSSNSGCSLLDPNGSDHMSFCLLPTGSSESESEQPDGLSQTITTRLLCFFSCLLHHQNSYMVSGCLFLKIATEQFDVPCVLWTLKILIRLLHVLFWNLTSPVTCRPAFFPPDVQSPVSTTGCFLPKYQSYPRMFFPLSPGLLKRWNVEFMSSPGLRRMERAS